MSGYPKDCKFCGQKIKLSEDSGRWLPYNLDNTAHECRDSTTKKDKGNDKDKPQPQNYTPQQQREFVESYRPAQEQPQQEGPQNKKQLTLEDLDARLKRIEHTLYGDSK